MGGFLNDRHAPPTPLRCLHESPRNPSHRTLCGSPLAGTCYPPTLLGMWGEPGVRLGGCLSATLIRFRSLHGSFFPVQDTVTRNSLFGAPGRSLNRSCPIGSTVCRLYPILSYGRRLSVSRGRLPPSSRLCVLCGLREFRAGPAVSLCVPDRLPGAELAFVIDKSVRRPFFLRCAGLGTTPRAFSPYKSRTYAEFVACAFQRHVQTKKKPTSPFRNRWDVGL